MKKKKKKMNDGIARPTHFIGLPFADIPKYISFPFDGGLIEIVDYLKI